MASAKRSLTLDAPTPTNISTKSEPEIRVEFYSNGAAVEKTGDTVMIDTANGVLGGNLSPLANGYNASNRTTAQDGFTFSIISGTTNGTTAVTDYSTLPEGIWSGDVSVQFDATWTS